MDKEILLKILYEVQNIKSNYDFWFSLIEIICTVVLVVPVIILIKEKIDSSKPKVIINFEIIRSSLACVVIRNVSNQPAELVSLEFNDEFLNELDERLKNKLLGLKNTKIFIAPNQKWVVNFETNIFEIINKFETKKCIMNYSYVKAGRNKKNKGNVEINFENYSFFTLYISELDEINQTLKKQNNLLEKIAEPNQKILPSSNDYTDISDLKDKWKTLI